MRASILFPALIPGVLIGAAALMATSFSDDDDGRPDPWAHLPEKPAHVDHSHFFDPAYFADVKDDDKQLAHRVTQRCLECHEDAGHDFMKTAHWNWKGDEVTPPGHDKPVRIGKANVINNFCISVQSNEPACTSCHTGYGWADNTFDFSEPTNIDCIVCHDHSGAYTKPSGRAGYPAPAPEPKEPNDHYKVDYILNIARKVGYSTRATCGSCHFNGGGGNAIKHGDLNGFMAQPTEDMDVHMGRHGLVCADCHQTKSHAMKGRSLGVSVDPKEIARCTDCHGEAPHKQDRLNAHVQTVACQTCHIPTIAKGDATKIWWDWSKAGLTMEQAQKEFDLKDPHNYLPIKGLFKYGKNLTPEYAWYNGYTTRYLTGDKIADPKEVLHLNSPNGGISDPTARISPFKIMRGKQPYDLEYKTLLIPHTYGADGFWGMTKKQQLSPADRWENAFIKGGEMTEVPYSGAKLGHPNYGWVETDMYWLQDHMVAPADQALQCNDCHTESGKNGRLDWQALGYAGDPAYTGGRLQNSDIRKPAEWAKPEDNQ